MQTEIVPQQSITRTINSATDTIGQARSDSNSVPVDNMPDATISLSVAAYKAKGVQYADLTWSGASSTDVDVYRNGVVIATDAKIESTPETSLGGVYAIRTVRNAGRSSRSSP